jgi:hypothetical protein
MQTILIIELKGFTEISTSLALRMEEIILAPEKIRAGIVEIINELIENVSKSSHYNSKLKVGGDTFVITFNELHQGIDFGVLLMSEILKAVTENGYYYLKPCACISSGNIVLHNDSFIDDTSISTYRVADKREPFTLWVKGNDCIRKLKEKAIPTVEHIEEDELIKIDWLKIKNIYSIGLPNFKLPQILLDNEVLFCHSALDALNQILVNQENANVINAFGGPIPFETANESEYLKQTIQFIKHDIHKRWNIISYLDISDKKSSFYWLELARRISNLYPDKYNFTAYSISPDTLIPFSYQTFDSKTTLVGLRSYSIERGRATMSSAIIFRNTKITERYTMEFSESYRKLGKFDDAKFSKLLNQIDLTEKNLRRDCMNLVDALLH